jgi:hypothetical protein
MTESEARVIADNCLYILMTHKNENPRMYEYMADAMDLSDEELVKAFNKLFPKEKIKG